MVLGPRLLEVAGGDGGIGLAEQVAEPRRAPHMLDKLRHVPLPDKLLADNRAIGGMRKPQVSVEKLPSLCPVGADVKSILDKFLNEHPEVEAQCLEGIGGDPSSPNLGPSETSLDIARRRLADYFGVENIGPVANGDFHTEIRADLLGGW